MSAENSAMEELYNQSIKILKEGQIIKGRIVSIKTKEILVDVGFKSEGIVPAIQFSKEDLEVGKELDFYIECIEDDSGMIGLSRDKAIRIQGWDKIVKNANDGTLVEGKPVKKVKGGFLIDVMGIEGFLPTSLSSFRGLSDKNILYKIQDHQGE
jgi:small subunit ribosomal protein S1